LVATVPATSFNLSLAVSAVSTAVSLAFLRGPTTESLRDLSFVSVSSLPSKTKIN